MAGAMYINQLEIINVRTFKKSKLQLLHPDRRYTKALPKPKLPNVNLLLGDNGAGKTTFLKAVAITGLGPAIGDAHLPTYRLARRERSNGGEPDATPSLPAPGSIEGRFLAHAQDDVLTAEPLISRVNVTPKSDEVERLEWAGGEDGPWAPVYSSRNDAFFMVGYGATRRVESRDRFDPGARQQSSLIRSQRVRSLFEEAYSLTPLSIWLPELQSSNPGRFTQVCNLINRLLEPTGYEFSGDQMQGEYGFIRGGLSVPFPALSDGYRAYLGWVGDLLYHVVQTAPSGSKLVENQGIVMVDEVDLHLHPKWQMTVLPTLAEALPKIQFIVTSHSPLVVGSLEWMNILHMTSGAKNSSRGQRLQSAVHGLDADQILLTDFFGLESTRASSREDELHQLMLKARGGSSEAAKDLLRTMSRGAEVMP